MKIAILASGSAGNSIYIEGNDTRLLIDAGLSGIKLQKRMEAVGVDPTKIDALLITHEHSDHIKGAGVISRRFDLPVYATRGTWLGLPKSVGAIRRKQFFDSGGEFEIGGIRIMPFAISHDVNEPVGFTFRIDKYKIGLATDLGFVSRLVGKRLEGSNTLILESNHDIKMLKNGSYPWETKQRILSRFGHLSNEACNDALSKLSHNELEVVAIAHLSQENNSPNLAERQAQNVLAKADRYTTKLIVANQYEAKIILDN